MDDFTLIELLDYYAIGYETTIQNGHITEICKEVTEYEDTKSC